MAHPNNASRSVVPFAFFTAATLAPAFISDQSAAAPPRYEVLDLGTLGGAESAAFGLNDAGHVVGWSLTKEGEQHACLWIDGEPQDLGTLGGTKARAWAINNAGVIVGDSLLRGGSSDSDFKAFIVEGGQMTMLPGLGGSWSVAHAINEAGQIAGIAANAVQQEKMVTWTGGEIVNLGPLTPHQRSRGYGINAAGAVAGWGYTPLFGPSDALLYDPALEDIVQIGGFGQFQHAEAYDVKDAGFVVGTSSPGTGDWTAAIWDPKSITEPLILGSFPGYELSELLDINNTNIAVGRAYTGNPIDEPSHAIYFDGETLHDLNDFLPEGTAGYLFEARHVNDRGAIAATMVIDGGFRAVLLVPQSGLLGDLDGNGVVDGADLGALLGSWGDAGSDADLDGDGTVDGSDLGLLLGNWS